MTAAPAPRRGEGMVQGIPLPDGWASRRKLPRLWAFAPGIQQLLSPVRVLCVWTAAWRFERKIQHGKTQSCDHRPWHGQPLGLTAAESWAAASPEGRCGIGPIPVRCFGAAPAPWLPKSRILTPAPPSTAARHAKWPGLAIVCPGCRRRSTGGQRTGCFCRSGADRRDPVQRHRRSAHHRAAARPRAGERLRQGQPLFCAHGHREHGGRTNLAIRFGLKGQCSCPRSLPVQAAPMPWAIRFLHRIRDGYRRAMLCGGAESCISPWAWAVLPA